MTVLLSLDSSSFIASSSYSWWEGGKKWNGMVWKEEAERLKAKEEEVGEKEFKARKTC